ncbi:MAG TPA: hypothetical protein VGM81_24865 [Burkholderiaceae bacterium]|jgi:hypothetical protein
MNTVQAGELPSAALLNKYRQAGAFTDCYFVDVPHRISQAEYVEAFYTTPLFKVERCLLALFVRRHSSDLQARQLANGELDHFAAWRVEGRTVDQLLLCDFVGKTRSWLMSVAVEVGGARHTRLYFGSAVVPKRSGDSQEKAAFGFAFHALSGFHAVYSRALLRAARSRINDAVMR